MTLPNIKSAIKRVKVNQKKNLQNRMVKTGVKSAVKKYETVLTTDAAAASSKANAAKSGSR